MTIKERIENAARGVDGNVAYMGEGAWEEYSKSLRAIDRHVPSNLTPEMEGWITLAFYIEDRCLACTPSKDLKPFEIKVGPAPK